MQAEVDAVWVGWGFVSERASFAQRCEEAGITFVGPDSATIRLLGDKVTAKRMAEKADVPVVPWSGGPVDDVAQAAEDAERLGYPVVLKATAGGGGRGIRVVREPADLAAAFTSARSEAELAFGDPAVFLEAFVPAARHVEVQVIADDYGTVWALGVRDCSIQRRNQKVIEESSSTVLDPRDRGRRSRPPPCGSRRWPAIATRAPWSSSSTPTTRQFLFMEVNTRLQVEHPVTEVTTGAGPGQAAAARRQRWPARGEPAAGARARRRGPAVRRGPRAGLRARARTAGPAAAADRYGRAGRLGGARGRRRLRRSSTR